MFVKAENDNLTQPNLTLTSCEFTMFAAKVFVRKFQIKELRCRVKWVN